MNKFIFLSFYLSICSSLFSMGKRDHEDVDITLDDQVCSLAKVSAKQISSVPSLKTLAAKRIGLHCTQFSLEQLQSIESRFPDELLEMVRQQLIIAHFSIFLQALEDRVALEYVNYLGVSPTARYALISTEEAFECLDFQNPYHVTRDRYGYNNEDKVIDAAFNNDGSRVLTLSETGRAILYDFLMEDKVIGGCRGKFLAGCVERHDRHDTTDGVVALDSTGTQAATAINCDDDHAQVHTWNLTQLPRAVSYTTIRTDGRIKRMTHSPDGQFLFLRSYWNELYNQKTGAEIPGATENMIAHSADLRFFISADINCTIIKDRDNPDAAISLASRDDLIFKAAFSNDGTFFITGSQVGKVQIWPMASYPQLAGHTIHSHADSIKKLAIAPTNDYAVSLSFDDEVRVFNTRGDVAYKPFSIEDSQEIKSLQISGDGKTVLISYKDGKTVAWYLVEDSFMSKELPKTTNKQRALTNQFIFCSDMQTAHVTVYHNPWNATKHLSFLQLSLMLKVLQGQCRSLEEMRLGILNLLTHLPTTSVCRHIARLLAIQNQEFIASIEKFIFPQTMQKLKNAFFEEIILKVHDNDEGMLDIPSWELTLSEYAFAFNKLNSLNQEALSSLAKLLSNDIGKFLTSNT